MESTNGVLNMVSNTTLGGTYFSSTTGTIDYQSNNTNVESSNYVLMVDCSVKFGGKNVDKIDWDLSRFTLIKRLKFLYDLLFKGKAVIEVDPKLIKLEKALEVLRSSK